MTRTVRGSCPGGGEIIRTRPDRPWGPPSLLYNGYRVPFLGVKRPGRGVNLPPLPAPRIKKEYNYLYLLSGPSSGFRLNLTVFFYFGHFPLISLFRKGILSVDEDVWTGLCAKVCVMLDVALLHLVFTY